MLTGLKYSIDFWPVFWLASKAIHLLLLFRLPRDLRPESQSAVLWSVAEQRRDKGGGGGAPLQGQQFQAANVFLLLQ